MSELEFSQYMKNVKWASALRFYISSIAFVCTIAGLYFAIKADIVGVNTNLTELINRNYYAQNKKTDSLDSGYQLQFSDIWNALDKKHKKQTHTPTTGCVIEKYIGGHLTYVPIKCP